jgi:lipoyl(octanoyl) transferase
MDEFGWVNARVAGKIPVAGAISTSSSGATGPDQRVRVPEFDDPFDHAPHPLAAYLLGGLGFDALLALQRRLVYDIAGDRDSAALVLCDHPGGITIGREGSAAHVRVRSDDRTARGWPVAWVARGGGTMLHVPGQVTCYPVLPLDALNLTPGRYVSELLGIAVELCRGYGVDAVPDFERPGVRAGGRRLVHLGVAVRDRVSSFGLIVNVNPDLGPFREVRCDGDSLPMTSLARESEHRVRVPTVRQRLVELIAARFGYSRVSVFHTHPAALPRPTRHAIPHGS